MSHSASFHGIPVLVVEDDPGVAFLVQRSLAREGIHCEILCSGLELFQKLESLSLYSEADVPHRYADVLLLVDHTLPDMTGKTLIENLSQKQIRAPFIFMTGNGSEKLAVEMMKLGAKDYLVKDPGFLDMIGPVVKRTLRELEMERKLSEVESALWENEERFRSMIENSSDLILILDERGNFDYVAPSMKKILGYPLSDAIQMSWKQLVFHEDYRKARKQFFRVLKSEETVSPLFEIRLQHHDGFLVDVEVLFNNLLSFSAVSGVIANCRDISERKKAEKALIEYQENLEQKVAERTKELEIALAKEKELGELKSRFVAMASHEFRTPLTTILSASDIIKRYEDRMTPEEKKDRIMKIQQQVHHMTRMLDEVLLIGKAESGKFDYFPVELDLETLVRGVTEDIRSSSGKEHLLDLSVSGNPRKTAGDQKLMLNLVSNLISNAVKYSPKKSRIEISLGFQTAETVLKVKDHGIGIPENDLTRLFEPFHRAANVGNISGTGLGLAIVKKAVDLHGGKIAVESQANEGTCFTVIFPENNGEGAVHEEDSAH